MRNRSQISRRDFLRLAGIGGAGAWLTGCSLDPGSGSASRVTDTTSPARVAGPAPSSSVVAGAAPTLTTPTGDLGARRLVVVELGGGNDGLSTLVPHGLPGFGDLRSNVVFGEDVLVGIDDLYARHVNLGRLADRGLAFVPGLGTANPDGSHCEMLERWWSGSPRGSVAAGAGFFGRLCDVIGDPAAAAVGVSIGSGDHPALRTEKVTTLSLPDAGAAGYLVGADPGDTIRTAFQQGYAAMVGASGDDWLETARWAGRDALAMGHVLTGLDQAGEGYTGSDLSNGLSLAAQLFSAEVGVRVVYVQANLNFDTHDDHLGQWPGNIDVVDSSIDAFLNDLGRRGLADQVLVMTISEFGRTAHDNGSGGLDHGTAGVAMLAGPVTPGVYGEHPSLTSFDDNGDLIATMDFDRYYATVAERWLGVPANEVLDGNPELIDGLLA